MEVPVTAVASPYRTNHTPLLERERVLEQELAHAREMLDAFCNEEVRIERKFLAGDAPREELAHVRNTLHEWEVAVERLTCALESVRAEIVERGERKNVSPGDAHAEHALRVLWFGALLFVFVIGSLYLRVNDTAETAPKGTTYGWGGPLEPGHAWLYLEGPPGSRFTVDGRSVPGPNSIPIWALHSHDVALEGGAIVVVRWIPCTTAVVRAGSGTTEPAVERFFNSATCY